LVDVNCLVSAAIDFNAAPIASPRVSLDVAWAFDHVTAAVPAIDGGERP
jgi:hypothetical protein